MRIWMLVGALAGLIAQAAPARPQQPAGGVRATKLAVAFGEVDRLFTEFAKASRVPGAAWGVVVDGELAHAGVAGVRDVSTNDPVTPDTVFRIASMTKSFTAMAILKLRD